MKSRARMAEPMALAFILANIIGVVHCAQLREVG
jgi:hypothetical protein